MRKLLLLLFLASCTSQARPWAVDSIASGDPTFDVARLIYRDPNSPLQLQFVRTHDGTFSYLSLNQFWFHPASKSPSTLNIRLIAGEKVFEGDAPLLEGNMRVRLPSEMTDFIITSLQGGQKVTILVDGFEKICTPETFAELYEEWMKTGDFFYNLWKGHIE